MQSVEKMFDVSNPFMGFDEFFKMAKAVSFIRPSRATPQLSARTASKQYLARRKRQKAQRKARKIQRAHL